MPPKLLSTIFAYGLFAGSLGAQTVYRCTDASGKSTYQETPCAHALASQNQTVLRIPNQSPPASLTGSPAARLTAAGAPPLRGSFTLYYDPANAPRRYPPEVVEAVIAYAISAWSLGCLVDIKYGGRAVYWPVGTRERVSIRWQVGYADRPHPIDFNRWMAGTGSLATGIELSPRINELRALFVHELGHVLGIGHLHGDPTAIMGYLRPTGGTQSAQPSAMDYLACNVSMKRLFGVAFDASAVDIARLNAAYQMSDRQAVDKLETLRR